MIKLSKLRAWLEPWTLWIKGDTWIVTVRICRSIDGKFDIRGKVQPYFGYYRDRVTSDTKPDRYTERHSEMTLINIWMPYIFFWFQRNDYVHITYTKPVYKAEVE